MPCCAEHEARRNARQGEQQHDARGRVQRIEASNQTDECTARTACALPLVAPQRRRADRSRGGGHPDRRRERVVAALRVYDDDVRRHRGAGTAVIVAGCCYRRDVDIAAYEPNPRLRVQPSAVRFRRDATFGAGARHRRVRSGRLHRFDRDPVAASSSNGGDRRAHAAKPVRSRRCAVRRTGRQLRHHSRAGRDDCRCGHRDGVDAAVGCRRLWLSDLEPAGAGWGVRSVRHELHHHRTRRNSDGKVLWLRTSPLQPAELDSNDCAALRLRSHGGSIGTVAEPHCARGINGVAGALASERTLRQRRSRDAAGG